jgi:hypothetical protein
LALHVFRFHIATPSCATPITRSEELRVDRTVEDDKNVHVGIGIGIAPGTRTEQDYAVKRETLG